MSLMPEYMKEMEKLNKQELDDVVMCSWANECHNYGIHCYHCKWNANSSVGNYLVLDSDKEGPKQKTLHFMEK